MAGRKVYMGPMRMAAEGALVLSIDSQSGNDGRLVEMLLARDCMPFMTL